MSKALEEAHRAGQVAAWKMRQAMTMRGAHTPDEIREPATSELRADAEIYSAYRDAFLAHLAEDEAVVERVNQIVAEGLYYGLPQVDSKLVPNALAGDIADLIVRTLAGKE